VTVNGVPVPLTFGGFSLGEPVGTYAIVVKDAGYATYFNNVTVSLGKTTPLTVALTPVTSSSTSGSGAAGISSLGWVLIALLGAVAAILLVTTLVLARRGRTPPSVQAYQAPPAATSGPSSPPPPASPPSGAAQPWQESPPTPPSGGSP
jgi:hypothetical protein